MTEAKLTKWFLYGNIGSGGLLNVGYKDKSRTPLAGKEYPTVEVATFKNQTDARFALEANEVLHETGMGPWELQQQRDKLLWALDRLVSAANGKNFIAEADLESALNDATELITAARSKTE